MSKRLDSLNTKKPATGPKPTLKFKPKAVARKSKEERDRDAPTVKQEPTPRPARGRGNLRGRGRGGRNNYAGTHVVLSGPLSSGTVSIGNTGASKTGFTQDRVYNSVSPTPDFLQNLKLKSEKPQSKLKEGFREEDESDDDDPTKINMNREYRYADEETILFPVRPSRIEVSESAESTPAPDNTPAPESKEATPGVDVILPSRETTVKSEPLEEKLQQIRAHKADLESKIAEPVDILDREEHDKMIDDRQHILNLVTDKFDALSTNEENQPIATASDDKFVLLHLPKVLPEYELPSHNTDAIDIDAPQDDQNGKNKPQELSVFASENPDLQGLIGHLNIHKSGKISINLGNDNNLSVSQGVDSNFLQELIILDMDEEKPNNNQEDVEMETDQVKPEGSLYRLGQIEGKIVATPSFS
ncbi:hypothetical protein QCA50_017432 [Cerrena zonata]|uniref:DNA-directed RNA polymerase III subunit RPC4 n=1 Tax=Cerrena zonata TaxID=2478898 RepID=A0AAW0FQE0_9APHY